MKKRISSPALVRLGVVGVGNMGAHHAHSVQKGLVPGCVLAAVCDSDAARLNPFSGVKLFTDFREMIHSGEIDALLIATPHYHHTAIGIEALRAGLHVLVEKPISVHKQDCERLIAAYKNRKKVFAVMFNQRTDPAYQKIREMVRSGELGKIQRIEWTITDWFRSQAYYDSGGWRATWEGEGGGVLLNQCIHNIDLFQWIFGMPDKIRAICHLGRHHHIEVEDEVTAMLEYKGGATAVFVTSTGEAPGVNRLEVAGTRGRLSFENGALQFIRNKIDSAIYCRTTKEGYRPPATEKIQIPIEGRGDQHLGIIKNFVNAILKGEKLMAPAVEGIHSVELANSILLSSVQDRTVTLPMSSAAYARVLRQFIMGSKFKKKVTRYHGDRANYLVDC